METRFLLQRNRGEYVAKPGSERSYTRSLRQARKFDTREEANAERCGDEHPVSLATLLDDQDA